MRATSVIILVIAILMGGIAAFLARSWLVSQAQVSLAKRSSLRRNPYHSVPL